MTEIRRLRKHLSGPLAQPALPTGIALTPVAEADPAALHALLEAAYTNGFGSVPALDVWWPTVTADSEYDEGLFLVATDTTGQPVGLCLCWTSGFIKDIAVAADLRGKGIGEALLHAAFRACKARGLDHVDLKVIAENTPALRLYHRLGMVQAPL